MNLVLLITVIIISFAFLAVNIYILVYFQHPDDKNTAYLPKFLIISGLLLAEAAVLLLPLDVANNTQAVGCSAGWNSQCGGLDMGTFWLIVLMTIFVYVVFFVPYTIFYYEADSGEDDTNAKRQCIEATKMEFFTAVAVIIVLVILFTTISQTQIPMKVIAVESHTTDYSGGFHEFIPGATLNEHLVSNASKLPEVDTTLEMNVSFPIYAIALLSFVGWFAFVFFAGIGLVALPMDLILDFIHRPQFIPADIYAEQKIAIQNRAAELLEIGKTIKDDIRTHTREKRSMWNRRKISKIDRITMNKFKSAVYMLEEDLEDLRICHQDFNQHNPLVPYVKLLLGIICAAISVLWMIQIIVFMLPNEPLIGFLNDYFMWFDQWFPLFGTLSVGIFALHLLVASVKGCFKFGVRCFCCTLHPVKFKKTYMNSLLFNMGLILLCSIPTVQFSNSAFSDYTRLTSIQTIMGYQMKNLKFFKYFWAYNAFVYAFLILSILTGIFLMIVPVDRAVPSDTIRRKIELQVREQRAND